MLALVKTYRKLQHWDHWLETTSGRDVLQAELAYLPQCIKQMYGKHALLIGTPQQYDLLKCSAILDQILLSPLLNHTHLEIRGIQSELHELPVASGSVDLVILPHTLEFLDHPRHLMAEACRIVKPEGHIIIFGFNPLSYWGLQKVLRRNKFMPWSGHFVSPKTVKNWLGLADFKLVKQTQLFFRPFRFWESLLRRFSFPFGNVYMVMAQAKVVPLTPIKMRWKQKIYGLSLPSISIPKPTARNQQL